MINQYELFSGPLGSKMTFEYKDELIYSMTIENPDFKKDDCNDKKYSVYMTEQGFLKAIKERGVKFTKINRTINFEMFWDKYNYKSSGKKEAEAAWNKLSKKDQLEAYDYISVYDGLLKLNPAPKLYGSSFLNKKRWSK